MSTRRRLRPRHRLAAAVDVDRDEDRLEEEEDPHPRTAARTHAPYLPIRPGHSSPISNDSTVPDTAPTANSTAATWDQRCARSIASRSLPRGNLFDKRAGGFKNRVDQARIVGKEKDIANSALRGFAGGDGIDAWLNLGKQEQCFDRRRFICAEPGKFSGERGAARDVAA